MIYSDNYLVKERGIRDYEMSKAIASAQFLYTLYKKKYCLVEYAPIFQSKYTLLSYICRYVDFLYHILFSMNSLFIILNVCVKKKNGPVLRIFPIHRVFSCTGQRFTYLHTQNMFRTPFCSRKVSVQKNSWPHKTRLWFVTFDTIQEMLQTSKVTEKENL